ncbi:hypothetical protein [Elioraea sp.]|uniref:hypothetical protein n=1 Tax=Elioraea sp. TaxID=2185103 RepID=UPI0025C48886|nr:hypothetical protein [Elioraea sp.]
MAFERILAAFRAATWRQEAAKPGRQIAGMIAADQQPPLSTAPIAGALTGADRAAFFAALRRKADSRAADLGTRVR